MSSPLIINPAAVFSKRYKDLFLSEKYTDCTFSIDQQKIKCHKLILAAASPVFEAMFYGPMSQEQIIEILDISPRVFLILIKYVYTGDVDLKNEDVQNLIELYYGTKKYMLEELERICLNAIIPQLRYNNILPVLDLVVHMDLQPLIAACNGFFSKGYLPFFKKVYNVNYHLSKDCIKNIIANNKGNKFLEAFVHDWCKAECRNQNIDEDKYLIVLEDLDMPQFKQVDCWDNSDIPNQRNLDLAHNYDQRILYRACSPHMISETCSQWSTWIKSNRGELLLIGVVISGRMIPPTKTNPFYTESLVVSILDENKVIHRENVFEEGVAYNCDFQIPFSTAVILLPEKEYCLKFTWGHSALGAEYAAGILSNRTKFVTFTENNAQYESIVKGINCLRLN